MSEAMVLCYHAVSPDWEVGLSVTPQELDRQTASLLRHGWRPTTFTKAILEPGAERTLAITFDDAFASVKRYALPILAARGAPATVFAPTSYMDGGRLLAWPGVDHWQKTPHRDELLAMDWDDLRMLAEAGWEIGSHTRTHPRLTRLDDGALRDELETSRHLLGERLGRECLSIAYPYGDVDPRVVAVARQAGYHAAAGLSRHLRGNDPHLYPRVGIYHRDTGARFVLKTSRPLRRLEATRLWKEIFE